MTKRETDLSVLKYLEYQVRHGLPLGGAEEFGI